MNTIELRNNFHKLMDKIDNDSILTKFYILLERASVNKESQLLERLSEDENKNYCKLTAKWKIKRT